jgi:hypothetical protein
MRALLVNYPILVPFAVLLVVAIFALFAWGLCFAAGRKTPKIRWTQCFHCGCFENEFGFRTRRPPPFDFESPHKEIPYKDCERCAVIRKSGLMVKSLLAGFLFFSACGNVAGVAVTDPSVWQFPDGLKPATFSRWALKTAQSNFDNAQFRALEKSHNGKSKIQSQQCYTVGGLAKGRERQAQGIANHQAEPSIGKQRSESREREVLGGDSVWDNRAWNGQCGSGQGVRNRQGILRGFHASQLTSFGALATERKPFAVAISPALGVGERILGVKAIQDGGPYALTPNTSRLNLRAQQTTVAGASRGVDFLSRLAWLESRNDSSAIGDHGKSRGAWQMSEAAWEDVNRLRARQRLPLFDWSYAHDNGTAREYAVQYLGILTRQFSTAHQGRNPSERQLIGMWRHGYRGMQRRGFFLKGTK